MATGILRFEPNRPERFAIAAPPEQSESSFSDKPEFRCRLIDGRLVYLKQRVKLQIDEMGVQIGEPIEVTQTLSQHGSKKIWGWSVRRVEQEQRPANHLAGNAPAAAPTTTPQVTGQAPQTQRTSYTQVMAKCWIASIDALIMARDYAKSQDLEFRITDESLRCCANSIFIAYDRANGGAR